MMAAAIMAAMHLVSNALRSHLLACTRTNQIGCVCTQAYEPTCFVHVYQSSLVIDKIPQFFNLRALGTLVAAVERVRLNRVHVPVVHPGGSHTIELSFLLPSLPD